MKSVRLINHNSLTKFVMLKHFFKKKLKIKIIRQLLLAVKKKIIQECVQRHVAYCPITLRHDKHKPHQSHTDLREKGQHRQSVYI